jgi:hypothetical protein
MFDGILKIKYYSTGGTKMRRMKGLSFIVLAGIFMLLVQLSPAISGDAIPDPNDYVPKAEKVLAAKRAFDDPRSIFTTLPFRKMLPKEVKDKFYFNREEMGKAWTDVVGFKATDQVGKISPEIKPGKYTYRDLETHPGLSKLMIPGIRDGYFKPGAPPFAGNFSEIEIVPTKQYYYALPVAEATKKNEGKAKLDNKGYLVDGSWIAGIPFPKPSGKFKAQQYMYNFEKRYDHFGFDAYEVALNYGFDKNVKMDNVVVGETYFTRLAGRVFVEPYGFLDERARKNNERSVFTFLFKEPRDSAGLVYQSTVYDAQKLSNQVIFYVPSMRRFRKGTATDGQSPTGGVDQIADDSLMWSQKLNPNKYPYNMEIMEDREYLVPIVHDGTEYYDSKNKYAFKNLRMMRRPLVVLKLTQLDKNYVYSKRIIYMDKETFKIYYMENYDQKGRLYRNCFYNWYFDEDMGNPSGPIYFVNQRDLIDLHSTIGYLYDVPISAGREFHNLKSFTSRGK